ncbi:hypothetical protein [Vibrio aquimaris]|uniref:Lipoprotein n=1 Tax=Vibrio aquimaris TaxID=2587862 RepID=A0A5P9CI34_9VIBR|nr:hypothetical protein [Vibrio aquimaris]QFT25914.1 hypothetical protein FIV01_05695 [Vibrio aquimaris]
MYKPWFGVVLIVCSFSVFGCYSQSERQTDELRVEPLASYSVNADSIEFDALSNGCSHNRDFAFVVDHETEHSGQISIIRLKEDNCRKMPAYKRFKLPLDNSLLGKEIIIQNLINDIYKGSAL